MRGVAGNDNGEDRMFEWEDGLPNADKLAPLTLALIPQGLASAFRILTQPDRTIRDVNLASKATILNIRDGQSEVCGNLESNDDRMVECDETADPDGAGSDSRKVRKLGFAKVVNAAPRTDDSMEDASARIIKRPRLTWTPQLHKRFVDVVSHLGLKDAVPRNIMQLMNVDGLTRENVASHLQKYRLYVKRTKLSSATEELFVPIPASQSSESDDSTISVDAHRNGYFPMTYVPSPMMPMMYFGMGAQGYTSMPVVNLGTAKSGGLDSHSLKMTKLRD